MELKKHIKLTKELLKVKDGQFLTEIDIEIDSDKAEFICMESFLPEGTDDEIIQNLYKFTLPKCQLEALLLEMNLLK